jgi:hypothetical protein
VSRHAGERERITRGQRHDQRAHVEHPKPQKVLPPLIQIEESAEVLVSERQLIDVTSEVPSQPREAKGEISGSSRRRFRKFDRRHRHRQGETQGTGTQTQLPTPSEVPSPPPLRQEEETLPPLRQGIKKEKVERGEKRAPDAGTDTPSPQRKKASSRKGWWQRLLE